MTNPQPFHVVESVSPASGNSSLAKVTASALANHIATLKSNGVPDANIFVYAPASLEITTVTTYTVNGNPV